MVNMKRTKLCDRKLPDYTKGEEIFNMVSHIVGGAVGVFALVACVIVSALHGDAWAVVSSAIYGASLILLYTNSSVYHGLHQGMAKKVMQVIDHCTIYFLIAGTYTPIVLTRLRRFSPGWGWSIFGIVWGLAILACVLTAIDLKKYNVFSMICYIGMGWCIIFAIKPTLACVPMTAIWYTLAGGIAYTLGAILYGLGVKHRYMHSVFHIFVVIGSVLQLIAILFYII